MLVPVPFGKLGTFSGLGRVITRWRGVGQTGFLRIGPRGQPGADR